MCGICGILNLDARRRADAEALERMKAVMGHRGPDDSGSHLAGNVALGHRRLSILDLSERGHQPMGNERGDVWCVFNGEIYNFKALRSELASSGHLFRSRCDTEVIIHAYEQYGLGCLSRLRGMFAFAIWDGPRRRLLLARDRVGIKPLYYHLDGKRLVWASEIKAILESGHPEPEIDLQALRNFMTLHYVPGPRTLFAGVTKLLPAHFLVCEGGSVQVRRYWELPRRSRAVRRHTDGEYEHGLYEKLEAAVARRLQSDVPVGALLSGGIDSSTVTAIMTRLQGSPVKAFCVGYSHDRHDRISEFNYARIAARHLRSDYYEEVVDSRKFLDFLPRAVWFQDEPLAEAPSIPLYYVCQRAKREGVTVVLTGEGSDELFAGYNRHWGELLARCYAALPRAVREGLIRPLCRRLPQSHLLEKATRTMALADFPDRYISWHAIYTEAAQREVFAPDVLAATQETCRDVFGPLLGQVAGMSGLDKILFLDLLTWLPDDLLMKKDKMGMAASIEARVPFLDQELVEYAWSMPASLKVRRLRTKYVLKKAVAPLLPREIIHRKKQGFPTPISRWMRGELKDYTAQLLLGPRARLHAYFSRAAIERLFAEHVSGRRDHGRQLFPLINLELWLRIFMGREVPVTIGSRPARRPEADWAEGKGSRRVRMGSA